MLDVVALGELLIDFTCVDTDKNGYPTLTAHPGGAPANFLATLSNFGAKTAFIGKIGADSFGNKLITTLHQEGISTEGMIADKNVFTTLAFVTLDQQGNREFSFARTPGADTCLRYEEINLKLIDEAKIFHFGSLSLTHEPARTATKQAVEYAKQKGKLITYDPNLRKPLWDNLDDAKKQILWGLSKADVVKISDEELDFLFGLGTEQGAAHLLSTFNTKLVFVTCGADGCYFKNPIAQGKIPSLSGINVIDTTGAGDIFGGSAIFGILQTGQSPECLTKHQLDEIVSFACTCAALSTTQSGGIPSIPSYNTVKNQLHHLSCSS